MAFWRMSPTSPNRSLCSSTRTRTRLWSISIF